MSETRDPRLDSRPGDVFRADGITRTVCGLPQLGSAWISYISSDSADGYAMPRRAWRAWASTAEVLHAEPSRPTGGAG